MQRGTSGQAEQQQQKRPKAVSFCLCCEDYALELCHFLLTMNIRHLYVKRLVPFLVRMIQFDKHTQ